MEKLRPHSVGLSLTTGTRGSRRRSWPDVSFALRGSGEVRHEQRIRASVQVDQHFGVLADMGIPVEFVPRDSEDLEELHLPVRRVDGPQGWIWQTDDSMNL